MRTKDSHFDSLVARYYPAVYSLASRLTDDPRQAIALTREAFRGSQSQLEALRQPRAIAAVLMSAVLRAGLATA